MMRLCLLVSVVCAIGASAECRPEGRQQFRAGLEALAHHDLAVAAAQFTALVQAQPDCAEARNNLAVVQVEQGRLSEAAAELRRALELRPDYERARVNLHRVEMLLAQRARATPPPGPTAPGGGLQAAAVPAATATVVPPPARVAAELSATAGGALLPAAAATAPGAAGVRVGVIDLAKREVCLYPRTAAGIAPPSCYAIVNHRIDRLAQWLLTGDTNGRRLRLVDETGVRRLVIAPEATTLTGDAIWLKAADFDLLAAAVIPWRTIWGMVQKPILPLEPAVGTAIGEAVERWRLAWEQKQFDAYAASYSKTFVPQADDSVAQWRARKRTLFAKSGRISVKIDSPSIFVIDDGTTAITLFEQHYRSGTLVADELKALRWKREDGTWKINAETVLHSLPAEASARK